LIDGLADLRLVLEGDRRSAIGDDLIADHEAVQQEASR
jgi:hypothetical protein